MKWIALILMFAVVHEAMHAQHADVDTDSLLLDRTSEMPEWVGALAPIIVPKIFQDTYRLKEFIETPEYAAYRKRAGDLRSVDVLFIRAMRLSWNNRFEALLISFFATMDHRTLGFRLPMIGSILWFPLTPEFQDEFKARLSGLPSELYADSPPEGDRDKLQHFFGSALFTYVTESSGAADWIGEFVEKGEELFIVGGVDDPRDVRANREGQLFGLALLNDPMTLPAPFFGNHHHEIRTGR